MPSRLPVPASVWTRVFRRIVAQLENDPDLRRMVEPGNLRSWKGTSHDRMAFAPEPGRPVLRLTPNPEGVEWYDPGSFSGELFVMVELALATLCIDDVADLWDVVVQALSGAHCAGLPRDLVALGAETGEIVCSEPAFDPRPQQSPQGYFLATGRFHLRIQP